MLMITCHMRPALTSGSYIHLAFIPLGLIKYIHEPCLSDLSRPILFSDVEGNFVCCTFIPMFVPARDSSSIL